MCQPLQLSHITDLLCCRSVLWNMAGGHGKLCVATMRNRLCKRCIICGQREVPDVLQCMTVRLSQHMRTLSVAQRWPHAWSASTIGYSSIHWMLWDAWEGEHLPLIQWRPSMPRTHGAGTVCKQVQVWGGCPLGGDLIKLKATVPSLCGKPVTSVCSP